MGPIGRVFLHDSDTDRWWRRHGMWLYLLACGLSILVVPVNMPIPAHVISLLGAVPAIGGLLETSKSPAKIVAWLVRSLLAYPVMHLCCRSRVFRNPDQPRWKLFAALAVLDLVLGSALLVDLVGLRGNRLSALIQSAMLSDGISLAIVAPLVSLVYAFVLFLNFHVLLTVFSDLGRGSRI